MKWRMYKAELTKALIWYTNKITEKFLYKSLTPATIELMRMELYSLQQRNCLTETNPVWKVPVDLVVNVENNHVEVGVTDISNVLFLDPE